MDGMVLNIEQFMAQCAIQLEMVKRRVQIPLVLYALFLSAMIVDVGGAFGLKYMVFTFILIYLLINVTTNRIKIPYSFVIVECGLFCIAPLVFLILAIAIFSVEPIAAVRELLPFTTWLLYPLIILIRPKERIISYFTTALFWGALFIVVMFCAIYLFHIFGQDEIISKINIFMYNHNLGYFGRKPYGGAFFPNIYPRWTLLLIPAAILLMMGHVRKFAVVILGTFLTTSTAAILFMLVGILWVSFGGIWCGRISKLYMKRVMIFSFMFLIGASIIYLLGHGYLIEFIVSKLGESPSTTIRVGHINSILALMSEDMINLLFGMGVGSSFWSVGVNQVVSNVEVSHFELMRQFGVLYATAFFSYVLLLFVKLHQLGDENGRLLSIGLIVLFLSAGTNPLLMSPIFILMLVISRAYITLTAREKQASAP